VCGIAEFSHAAAHPKGLKHTGELVDPLPQAATDAQRPQAERAFLCRLLTGSAQANALVLLSLWHQYMAVTVPSHHTIASYVYLSSNWRCAQPTGRQREARLPDRDLSTGWQCSITAALGGRRSAAHARCRRPGWGPRAQHRSRWHPAAVRCSPHTAGATLTLEVAIAEVSCALGVRGCTEPPCTECFCSGIPLLLPRLWLRRPWVSYFGAKLADSVDTRAVQQEAEQLCAWCLCAIPLRMDACNP